MPVRTVLAVVTSLATLAPAASAATQLESIVAARGNAGYVVPGTGYVATQCLDVPYLSLQPGYSAADLKLDLLLPHPTGASTPLIVYVHGGGWVYGNRRMYDFVQRLVPSGYAVASVTYRLGWAPDGSISNLPGEDIPRAKFPAQIQDVKSAVRFLKANAGALFDANHVGAWGDSSGGHLVTLLGVSGGLTELEGPGPAGTTSRVQAVCDYYGQADLTVWSGGPNAIQADPVNNAMNWILAAPGDPFYANDPADAHNYWLCDPIQHADAGTCPFLIVHGSADRTVTVQCSRDFDARLSAIGIPHQYIELPGLDHATPVISAMQQPPYATSVRDFFDTYLKTPAPLTASISSPADGAVFAATNTITVTASASSGYAVTKVEFSSDATLLATDTAAPWSWTCWPNLAPGAYTFSVKAYDANGRVTASSPVHITVSAPAPQGSTPYSGTAIALPGTIQAELFDNGGEGVAYHDTTATNDGGAFRATGVDLETCPGGYDLAWTRAGEWLVYSVNIAKAGTYALNARVAAAGAGGTFHVECDGTNVTGAIAIPDTGAWTSWQTITRTGVTLPAGAHRLKLVMDTVGASSFVGNIDQLAVVDTTGSGTGLFAEYFADMTLTNRVLTRVDPTVDFDWGVGSPAAGVPADHFSRAGPA